MVCEFDLEDVAPQTRPRRYCQIRHATSKRSKHFILLIQKKLSVFKDNFIIG